MKTLEKIQDIYYSAVPFDYRPFQIWYRLKCWVWHRYTTVKPRTLKYHTWCDKDILLIHTMFEILSRFIEKECSPGIVDWYHEDAYRIIPGYPYDYEQIKKNLEHSVLVRDEMQDLYDWWHKEYLLNVDNIFDKWHEWFTKHSVCKKEDNRFIPLWTREWDTEENKKISTILRKEAHDREEDLRKELENRMVRLVYVSPFFWT